MSRVSPVLLPAMFVLTCVRVVAGRQMSRTVLVMAACVLMHQPASADVIRYDFSGVVQSTSGTAPQAIGDTFTGSLVIDTDLLPTTEQDPEFRRFDGPVDFQVSFQSQTTGREYLSYTAPWTDLVVNNNAPSYDGFRASLFDPDDRNPVFGLYFIDDSGTALSSTDLPRSMDPRAFGDWRMFYATYWSDWRVDEPPNGQFNGLVTSLNGIEAFNGPPEAVTPEPGSIVLLGTAVAALVRRSRMRRGER